MVSSKDLPQCPECYSLDVDVELDFYRSCASRFPCTCKGCGHQWEEHLVQHGDKKQVPSAKLFQKHKLDLTETVREYLKRINIPCWNCRDHLYHWFRGEIRGRNALFHLYIGINDPNRFIIIGIELPFSIPNEKLTFASEFCMQICQFPFVKMEIDYSDRVVRISTTHDASDCIPSFETFMRLLQMPFDLADRLYPSIIHLAFANTPLMEAVEEAKRALKGEE